MSVFSIESKRVRSCLTTLFFPLSSIQKLDFKWNFQYSKFEINLSFQIQRIVLWITDTYQGKSSNPKLWPWRSCSVKIPRYFFRAQRRRNGSFRPRNDTVFGAGNIWEQTEKYSLNLPADPSKLWRLRHLRFRVRIVRCS